MVWSQGHNWVAEIPFIKLNKEISKDKPMEFKFVVKKDNGGGHMSVDRWEGGNGNHVFDEAHT